ncbi:AMP-binding protein [Rhodococcoides kyotonense]|uniref:Fatty-acyl-CoA synthase n=1 Tax=Rhodococcoides kyotonense TaxID=398843 RepID=A0A239JZP3_9NOCA|nr:AMP-binding protein [Rhodococcus kyotonensis]SNT11546.1 fatty-acyl-CoA synthase [Rhodococcus kyotonensis]
MHPELSLWPSTPSTGVRDITLGGLLREAASTVPDRVALVDGVPEVDQRTEWTYRELLIEVESVARALLTVCEPGDRIGIWAPNSGEWVILQQAVAMAGMVVVAANPAYRAHELEYVLRQSGAVALFYRDSYRGTDLRPIIDEIRPNLPALRTLVSTGQWKSFVDAADHSRKLPDVASTDPVQIQYTSGTTGFPKGALLHHKGIINEATFVFERADMQDGGVCINAMPMYHIGGGAVTELGTFSKRGTYVVLPGFDAGLTLEMFETYKGTHSLMVPTMLIALLDHPDLKSRDMSSLRTVMSGAATVPESLIHRVIDRFDCQFTILFGQTEMHGVISQTRVTDDPSDQATTVGQPLPELEVKIADPLTGEVVPIDEQGEICCRGYQNMLAYYEMPDATADTIDADGWLRMGDLGTMDSRGFIKVTGRLKDVIIRGGANLYPREIEELLFRHPAIADVVVVGVPDEKWGEQVGAVIRMHAGHDRLEPEVLKAWCRERISAHKTPSQWYFTDAFPMTPSGKIQKFKLRDQIVAGELTSAAERADVS